MQAPIKAIYNSKREEVVPGTFIERPIPQMGFKKLGPYILLDHLGPEPILPGNPINIPAHPHVGFSPVSIVLDGYLAHKDSMGNYSEINPGDVQWLTAGRGMMHEELSQKRMDEQGGTIHFVQLWVNLPKAFKKIKPAYQYISSDTIPNLNFAEGVNFRLIAGKYEGAEGPAKTYTKMVLGHLVMKAGSTVSFTLPESFDKGFFLAEGTVEVGDKTIEKEQLVVFENGFSTFTIIAKTDTDIIILTGEPINEPLIIYGPFVVNSLQEIPEVLADYDAGKMGVVR